ncbi:lipoate---protein ligase [Entomortierella parvispora]|uniref:Putative lipoate-protein ligase A n=1 Tax=Entomortierella parvispora TaxID=205924 RepID=A0A9P3HI95_9FUNG|nr:lipoate---protein ligase [Entomortierella parvispora]
MATTDTPQQQSEATNGNSANTSTPKGNVPRGPIRRHERIVTSDEEIKEFNKGYYQKAQSQYLDPCQAQTKASMKCMEANNFDKRRCTRFFKDYSDCKKKWLDSLREDRRKKNLGITDEDDMPEVKKESPAASTWLTASRSLCRRSFSTSGSTATEGTQPLSTKNSQGNFKVATYISKTSDPWSNLAFEEWLFRNSDPTTYILFLYRNSKSVIIGRNQNPWKECNLKQMAKDGVPFVRRKSGGGTVYHDMGNTNYSIMMPRAVFDRRTNVDLICRALHELDIPAIVNERHDIVLDGKKVSGSAFKLIQHRSYHHGTMLIDTDLSTLGQYLRVNANKTSLITKGVASVRSPVTRLRESSFTIDHLSFCEAVRTEFLKRYAFDTWRQNLEGEPVIVDEALVDSIDGVKTIRDDMRTWEWMYGQTPEFTYQLGHTFSWGSVNVSIRSKEGQIIRSDIESTDMTNSMPSLALTALGIGMEGQRYDEQGLDEAVQRVMYEAPEVLAPTGGAEQIKDVVKWLKEQL